MDTSSISNLAAPVSAPARTVFPQPANADQRALIQAVKAVSGSDLLGPDHELIVVLDRSTRRALVRIVSRQTGEVIQQIPAEYVVRMARELTEGTIQTLHG
jgi:hemin uptake protein HemP